MKKIILLIAFIATYITSFAQTNECKLLDGILDDPIANRVYMAIKERGMEKHLYCSKDGNLMLGYKNNPQGEKELQVGFFYNVESAENWATSEKRSFVKAIDKIYKAAKGKDKKKPLISFRMYLVSSSGVYALGKSTYNEKGKPSTYLNEKNKNTIHDYNIFYRKPSKSDYYSYSYTSDIIW